MGRIDGNPTPVSHEEQALDAHEEEEYDYEPVVTTTTDQANNYAEQQEKPPQKLHLQSPHHHHQPPQVVAQAFPPPHDHTQKPQAYPPPQQGGFHSPHPYPPPTTPQGQPQAFPPPHGYAGQAQFAQPQPFPLPQHNVQYQPPPQHNVQASPVPVPMGVPQYPQFTEGWKTGLFDCFQDPTNTLVTACFPCVTFGQIAEIIDNGQTPCATSGLLYGLIAFFIAMPCLISCTYRTKIRNRYGLIESPAPDWLTHCCFEWCALCQEYRELQLRGFDPAIGWQGNLAKNQNLQHQQVAMMPPMNQTMMG